MWERWDGRRQYKVWKLRVIIMLVQLCSIRYCAGYYRCVSHIFVQWKWVTAEIYLYKTTLCRKARQHREGSTVITLNPKVPCTSMWHRLSRTAPRLTWGSAHEGVAGKMTDQIEREGKGDQNDVPQGRGKHIWCRRRSKSQSQVACFLPPISVAESQSASTQVTLCSAFVRPAPSSLVHWMLRADIVCCAAYLFLFTVRSWYVILTMLAANVWQHTWVFVAQIWCFSDITKSMMFLIYRLFEAT